MLAGSPEFQDLCWALAEKLAKHRNTCWPVVARVARGVDGIPCHSSKKNPLYSKYHGFSLDEIYDVLLSGYTEPVAFFEATYGFMSMQECRHIQKKYLGEELGVDHFTALCEKYPYERSEEIWEEVHREHGAYAKRHGMNPWTFWSPRASGPVAPSIWDHLLEAH